MQCPKCESEMQGTSCACGYAQSVGLSVCLAPGARRWKLCEWVPSAGRTCQAPAGLVRSDGVREPRLCAYHQHRKGLSLYGAYTSEQQAFLNWVEQFPPGTTYQPMPGIWDRDRELLWALLSGSIRWDEFQVRLKSQVSA